MILHMKLELFKKMSDYTVKYEIVVVELDLPCHHQIWPKSVQRLYHEDLQAAKGFVSMFPQYIQGSQEIQQLIFHCAQAPESSYEWDCIEEVKGFCLRDLQRWYHMVHL